MDSRTLIIGVGNDERKDDGIGLLVARAVKELNLSGVTVLEQSGDGTALMDLWDNYSNVILIDAISSGSSAGSIFRFDAHEHPLPVGLFHCSTHAIGIAELVELARALNRLPPRFTLCAIEGVDFGSGSTVSAELKAAVPQVVKQILAECRAIAGL